MLDQMNDFFLYYKAFRSKIRLNFVHVVLAKPVKYYGSFTETFIYFSDHLWMKWSGKLKKVIRDWTTISYNQISLLWGSNSTKKL